MYRERLEEGEREKTCLQSKRKMATSSEFRYTAYSAFLDTLYQAGVRYLFVNLGTDHPGLLETFGHASITKRKNFPKVITAPSEMVALTIATAYAQMTGECQAVLVHVETGTLALGGALHNVFRARVPVFIFAGASPSTISGEVFGGRTEYIQFVQDVHDQRGIVRGYVKYNNEYRFPQNVPQLTLRAIQMARSAPAGPVYLMGARDVMEASVEKPKFETIKPQDLWKDIEPLALTQKGVEDIVTALSTAAKPLIITTYSGKNPKNLDLMVKLVEKTGAGVLDSQPSYVNFPTNHWAYYGVAGPGKNENSPVRSADVILLIDCDVPWVPFHIQPLENAKILMIDLDPIKENMPMHYLGVSASYRVDSHTALLQLTAALDDVKTETASKETALKRQHATRLSLQDKAEKMQDVITCEYLAACIRDIFEEASTVVINESTTNSKFFNDHLRKTKPGALYNIPSASLGWSGGAAIAAKLAFPEKTVVQIVGDGSYLFTVPTTVHWMARRYATPFITVVLNNRGWKAPKRSNMVIYPQGLASQVDASDIHCSFDPPPNYCGVAEAAGGCLGIKVEKPHDVKPALEKAKATVKTGQGVLLDIWLPKF